MIKVVVLECSSLVNGAIQSGLWWTVILFVVKFSWVYSCEMTSHASFRNKVPEL